LASILNKFKLKTKELMTAGQPEFVCTDTDLLAAEEKMFAHSQERLWYQPYRQITQSKKVIDNSKVLLRQSWRETIRNGTLSETLALKILTKQANTYFERLAKVK
jgi:hypothetical protein